MVENIAKRLEEEFGRSFDAMRNEANKARAEAEAKALEEATARSAAEQARNSAEAMAAESQARASAERQAREAAELARDEAHAVALSATRARGESDQARVDAEAKAHELADLLRQVETKLQQEAEARTFAEHWATEI